MICECEEKVASKDVIFCQDRETKKTLESLKLLFTFAISLSF